MTEKYIKQVVTRYPSTLYRITGFGLFCLALIVTLLFAGNNPTKAAETTRPSRTNPGFPRIVVSFPAEVHPEPVTARVLLLFSRSANREPLYTFSYSDPPPVYAIDVTTPDKMNNIIKMPRKSSRR